jgi:hypothetical protein
MADPVHNIKKKFVNFNNWEQGLLASRSLHSPGISAAKVAVGSLWSERAVKLLSPIQDVLVSTSNVHPAAYHPTP